uniref:Single-stranded DNA-binding protein n=1 Tax=Lygus hesperus TaxID=30085 RepID=A0A0A9Y7B6_LYGHE
MEDSRSAVDSGIDYNHGNPIPLEGPPYPIPAQEGPNPIYQNLLHTRYETPVDPSNQHHEHDQNSMNSYGFDHVYANPTFSGYPEIPAPDYSVGDNGSRHFNHPRRHSSDSSDSSFSSKVGNQSSPTTRRASSPTIEEAPLPSNLPPSHPPDHDFYNIPLDVPPNCPRSEDTITVIAVPEDYGYWSVGIYSMIAFVLMIIVILVIWSLVYYGI